MKEFLTIKKKLNKKNKIVLVKILNYIYACGINTKIFEKMRIDIAQMIWDSQERGEEVGQVIGEDYKNFCDELIENAPRKSFFDVIVEIGLTIGVSLLIIIPMLYIFAFVFPTAHQYVKGVNYIDTYDSIVVMIAGMLAGGGGSFIMQRYAFSKKKMMLYIVGFMTIYGMIIGIASIWISKNGKDQLLNINMLAFELGMVVIVLICALIREIRMKRQMNKFKE